ncbi:MAG: hypothetical protein JKX74_00870 [Flavobacteriales bacterium]|nr:hypothetical protein [Flavobacteriales bacterium]
MIRTLAVLLFLKLMLSHIGLAQGLDKDSLIQRASEEYPVEYEGVLKTNPLSMLWGSIPLTAEFMVLYEFVTAPQQASQVGISYIGKSPVLKAFEDTVPDLNLLTISGVRLQLSHRFYFLKSYDFAPRGLYLSPHISYATAKVSTKHFSSQDVFVRINQFNLNTLLGWQWIYKRGHTLDVFGGLGYKDNFWEIHDAQNTISLANDDMGKWYTGPVKLSFGFYFGLAL